MTKARMSDKTHTGLLRYLLLCAMVTKAATVATIHRRGLAILAIHSRTVKAPEAALKADTIPCVSSATLSTLDSTATNLSYISLCDTSGLLTFYSLTQLSFPDF